MPGDTNFDASGRQNKHRPGYGSRARFRHQLKEAGVSSYVEYLRSDHWHELKASWVPRRTWQRKAVCELCLGRVGPFELHHKNYSRIGREPRKHLILICRACHQWIHGWHERSRETLSKITKRVAILARKKGVRFRQERISAGATFEARRKFRIVPGDGDPCPRCGQPTQIREHKVINERELTRPFYYSRWFNCTNASCKTTLIMPSRYIVRKESSDAVNADRTGAG
jgi:hypothetical protein